MKTSKNVSTDTTSTTSIVEGNKPSTMDITSTAIQIKLPIDLVTDFRDMIEGLESQMVLDALNSITVDTSKGYGAKWLSGVSMDGSNQSDQDCEKGVLGLLLDASGIQAKIGNKVVTYTNSKVRMIGYSTRNESKLWVTYTKKYIEVMTNLLEGGKIKRSQILSLLSFLVEKGVKFSIKK